MIEIQLNIDRKQIKGFSDYWIYEDGRIWSNKRGIFLKTSFCQKGYPRINLGGKNSKTYRIHRLVATHFVLGYNDNDQVCHNDSNKLNNWAHNLRWDTAIANSQDKIEDGVSSRRDVMRGDHILQKLIPSDVENIVQLLTKTKKSLIEIGAEFNIHRTSISNINTGKSWSHFTKDYVDSYPIRKKQ